MKLKKYQIQTGGLQVDFFQKWAFRLEYVILIFVLLIMMGNIAYIVNTGDYSKFVDFFKSIWSLTEMLLSNFFTKNSHDKSIFINFVIWAMLLFSCYRINKKAFYIVIAIIVNMLLLPSHFSVPYKSFLIDFYKTEYPLVTIASGIIFAIPFLILFSKRMGRNFIYETARILIQILIVLAVIYYAITSQFYIVRIFLSGVWSEVSFSIDYLTIYIDVIAITFLTIVLFSILFSTVLAIVNYFNREKLLKERKVISNEDLPYVGVTIPAYNEEGVIVQTVEAALNSDYPAEKLNVIVVCDGSKDETLLKLLKRFSMINREYLPFSNSIKTKRIKGIWVSEEYPSLTVILKENGGKHDALNCGLNFHHPLVTHILNLDADTILEEKAVLTLASEVVNNSSELLAVTGMILPEYRSQSTNGIKDWIIKNWTQFIVEWQRLDYISSFHISRGSLSLTNSMFIVSGAFGLFSRKTLYSLMGYRAGLGEDMDITLKIQSDRLKSKNNKNMKIVFIPEATGYTAAPLSFKELSKQRKRWFKGLIECILRFKHLLLTKLWLNYLLFILVELLAPILAPVGIIYLTVKPEIIYSPVFQTYLCLFLIFYMFSSMVALFIEKKHRKVSNKLFIFATLQFVLIPFSIFWRNDALIHFKDKNWGAIRKSFK